MCRSLFFVLLLFLFGGLLARLGGITFESDAELHGKRVFQRDAAMQSSACFALQYKYVSAESF
jgi:hypothetical protein